MKRALGFTVIEILTAIAIVVIMAAISFPLAMNAKRSAMSHTTIQNLRSLQVGAVLYQADHHGADSGTIEEMGLPSIFGTVQPYPFTDRYLSPWYRQMKSPFGNIRNSYMVFAIDSKKDGMPIQWRYCTRAIGDRCIIYFDPYEPGKDPITGGALIHNDYVEKKVHGITLGGSLITRNALGSPYTQAWWAPEVTIHEWFGNDISKGN